MKERTDTERLDWIERKQPTVYADVEVIEDTAGHFFWRVGDTELLTGPGRGGLRAAIDAAMDAGKEPR